MISFQAKKYPYQAMEHLILGPYFPYLLDRDGEKQILQVSPDHGRSFVVGRHEDGSVSRSVHTTRPVKRGTLEQTIVDGKIEEYTIIKPKVLKL